MVDFSSLPYSLLSSSFLSIPLFLSTVIYKSPSPACFSPFYFPFCCFYLEILFLSWLLCLCDLLLSGKLRLELWLGCKIALGIKKLNFLVVMRSVFHWVITWSSPRESMLYDVPWAADKNLCKSLLSILKVPSMLQLVDMEEYYSS